MNNIIKATLGNQPVLLSINPTVAIKLAKKATIAITIVHEKTIAFKLPGDHFGVEVLEGNMNYSSCYNWYFNVTIDITKNISEVYLSWVEETHGKPKLGLTEIFHYTMEELNTVVI